MTGTPYPNRCSTQTRISQTGEQPELGLEPSGFDVGEHRHGPCLRPAGAALPAGTVMDVAEMAPQRGLAMPVAGPLGDGNSLLQDRAGAVVVAALGEDERLAVE